MAASTDIRIPVVPRAAGLRDLVFVCETGHWIGHGAGLVNGGGAEELLGETERVGGGVCLGFLGFIVVLGWGSVNLVFAETGGSWFVGTQDVLDEVIYAADKGVKSLLSMEAILEGFGIIPWVGEEIFVRIVCDFNFQWSVVGFVCFVCCD